MCRSERRLDQNNLQNNPAAPSVLWETSRMLGQSGEEQAAIHRNPN